MSDLSAALTGLTQGINGYLQQNQKAKADQNQDIFKNNLDIQKETAKQQDEAVKTQADNDAKFKLEGQVSPELAEQALPGAGGNLVKSFQQANGRLPTVKEAHDYLKLAADNLGGPDTEKADKRQDTLENQAINRISSVRGDAAVARSELQRDAAGQAYDTISKAQHEKRDLTSLEQTDLLAQLFQARTGKAPTDSDMKNLNDKTAKMGLNQAVTFVTGNPSLVGASTDKTLDNLKQFVQSTGMKADSNHEGYMGPHLIKPTGLSDDRWQHILASHRGISFADQMKTSDTTYSKAAIKANAAKGDPLGIL